jgi:elongation of very long chain fatty acids protein 4
LPEWLGVRFCAAYAGDVYYTVVLNSFVHLVMYYYYLKASFGASPRWGKYLTQLQMVQFVSMNAQAMYLLYNSCDFPRKVTLGYLFYILSLLVLFLQFYFRKHCSSPRSPASKAAKTE